MLNDEKLYPVNLACSCGQRHAAAARVLLARHHRLARRRRPLVVAFVLLQRFWRSGLTAGAVEVTMLVPEGTLLNSSDRTGGGTGPRTVLAMGREIHGSLLAEGASTRFRTVAAWTPRSHITDFTEAADTNWPPWKCCSPIGAAA